MDFRDRTVVVTGAAGQLGRAVTSAFDAAGANLVLVERHRGPLVDAFGAETPRRQLVAADLLDRDDVDRAIATAAGRFGRIDALCNIVGGFRMGEAVHELSDETLDFVFDINVRSLVHAAHAVVPHMLDGRGGRIVNVAAFAANRGAARMGAYSAAKSAVIRLTEAMEAELHDRGVHVNCVLPTIIDTPDNRKAMPDADTSAWVAPQDLANVILFLASEDARAIRGAAIPVGELR
ncbi:MAG: SDR family NAD(P)-dependent oxidoreductase [Betaproteobacteria bacterium]